MTETKVGIVGLGAIGRAVARRLSAGIPGLRLTCAASRDTAKAAAWLAAEAISCPLVELCDFPRHADLVLECAPAAMLEAICTPMLAAGKRVMVLSAGALLPRPHLIDLARRMAARSSSRPARCSASTPWLPQPRAPFTRCA